MPTRFTKSKEIKMINEDDKKSLQIIFQVGC